MGHWAESFSLAWLCYVLLCFSALAVKYISRRHKLLALPRGVPNPTHLFCPTQGCVSPVPVTVLLECPLVSLECSNQNFLRTFPEHLHVQMPIFARSPGYSGPKIKMPMLEVNQWFNVSGLMDEGSGVGQRRSWSG